MMNTKGGLETQAHRLQPHPELVTEPPAQGTPHTVSIHGQADKVPQRFRCGVTPGIYRALHKGYLFNPPQTLHDTCYYVPFHRGSQTRSEFQRHAQRHTASKRQSGPRASAHT